MLPPGAAASADAAVAANGACSHRVYLLMQLCWKSYVQRARRRRPRLVFELKLKCALSLFAIEERRVGEMLVSDCLVLRLPGVSKYTEIESK